MDVDKQFYPHPLPPVKFVRPSIARYKILCFRKVVNFISTRLKKILCRGNKKPVIYRGHRGTAPPLFSVGKKKDLGPSFI